MGIITKSFQSELFEVTYQAEPHHEGMRLDQFVQVYLPSFSRQQVKNKITCGDVMIEGRIPPHRPSVKIHERNRIYLRMNKTVHEDEYWNNQKIKFDINPEEIYQDNDLLVINKPAFMATHPTGKHLFYAATVFFEEKYKMKINSLHRLDRETSGVLLLGKNARFSSFVTDFFENSEIKKCYFFIGVKQPGTNTENSFSVKLRLGTLNEGRERVIVNSYPEKGLEGKSAHTDFFILEKKEKYILGLAFPKTGRQHQIRVHAKSQGMPLLGDKLYLGGYKIFQRFKDLIPTVEDHNLMEIPRHALHAMALKIPAIPPLSKEEKIFIGKFPKDLRDWMKMKLNLSEFDCLNIEHKAFLKIEEVFEAH